jgi:DMSO/TMAO reductase YedYZ molybdopterin-dependent catalytic subunit
MEDERLIRSPDMERSQRVPPGQQVTDDMPVLHHGPVQRVDVSKWKFKITGLVQKKVELTFDQFKSLPMVKVASDIHCVTGWSKLDNTWEGVSTGEIKTLVDILPSARFVMVHSVGGFTTNLSMEDFFQPDVIFAVRQNGEPIAPEHGFPVRLVVPRLYFWKSAKWVEGMEFMESDKPGFWESHGYHIRGDPWKEERYDYQ